MKSLKSIAANLAFLVGAVFLLLPLGVLSLLLGTLAAFLKAADDRVCDTGWAIRRALPEPDDLPWPTVAYCLEQLVCFSFFGMCMLGMVAMMQVGYLAQMLAYLLMAMMWAIMLTRNWERRNCSVSHMQP